MSLAFFFLFFTVVSAVFATGPELKSILPTGAQRGTEVEVSFNGERLQDTEEVICYEPGIRVLNLNLVTNKVVKGLLKVGQECNLGEHHFRLRTATGLSELRTFFVGPYPVIDEKEPNNQRTNAQRIEPNSTVQGVITSEDVDYFEIVANPGQLLSIEAEAIRLGNGVFDPRLLLLDANGSILADVDDTWLGIQDPFISLVTPASNSGNGTNRFFVQMREATYGGNEHCHYRLHVGAFPRPTTVFPPGGQAGQIVDFTFFSEATGEFTQKIRLPEATSERLGVFAELGGLTAPTPNWVRVSPFPNVIEASADSKAQIGSQAPASNSAVLLSDLGVRSANPTQRATLTGLELPLAFNGILSQPGQEDWFRFKATKDVALEIQVYARRLRSPLDSVLDVLDAQGKSLASNDDAAGADSSLKFTPPTTTNYFVRIRDTLGKGGKEFVYRIEIKQVQPALSIKIPEVARNDTQSRQFITVPRGNRFATLISAKRSDFGGDLRFGMEGLPTGVTMSSETMPGNTDTMPLVLEASPDAPLSGKLLELTATGTNSAGNVVGKFRQDIELVQGAPNNAAYYSTTVDKLCIAVTKEAPFKLRIVEPKVPLVQAGSMRLEIVAERATNFDQPIHLQMVWNPPGVSSQSEATIEKDGTNVSYQLNAGGGADLRSWKIAVLGHAEVDGGQQYISTQLAPLEVAAPYLSGKIETLSLKPGESGKLTVHLEQSRPFDGKAIVRLAGLPEKVTTADKEITKDDHEVAFDLNVDPKCPTGSHKNLFCAVDVKENGQVISHTIAAGGILRIVPKPKEETKVAVATKAEK
jgi:hypothetical protein